jgi:tripartite-type tricarboxylate transporter receptor subunit TctC
MNVLTAVIAITALAPVADTHAQNYPDKTVTMVVAFPAGGSTDIVGRTLAQHMSEIWNQPVVILNRAGADGRIGTESVVRAAPDGYTLLVGTTALAINPAVFRKMNYDALKDLVPITQLVATPNALVVHPSIPAKSVRELVALAKARPGLLNSASGGTGTSNHLALVLFNMMAGVNIAHIPYKGVAPALIDIVGGHVDMTFTPIVAAVQLVQSGKLRALAVTTAVRASSLPQVPTVNEAGVAGYEASSWAGLFAPAATPRAVIGRIHSAAVDSLRSSQVREVLARNSAEPVGNTPDEFALGFRREIDKWAKVVKASGEKIE